MIRTRSDKKILRLAETSLFSACTRNQLMTVGSISTEVRPPTRAVLCDQDQPGEEFFVVLDGYAEVAIDGERVRDVEPGDFFGELALLGAGRRTATVAATSPMRLLVLTRREFGVLLDRVPTAAFQIHGAVGDRLRSLPARRALTATW